MKLNKMSKEELETLAYSDLTEMILKEKKKAINTPILFKEICKLLELTDDDYANQIGDYYTSLTTDKRFILLDNACWDLKDKYKVEVVLDEDDEEYDDEAVEEDDEVVETVESEDIDAMEDEEGIDNDEDDLEDLTIIEDEDIEEE